MRIFFIIGVILLILGIASLFVPIPHQQRHGFDAGPISVGVTTDKEKVHPAISAALIIGGVVLMVAGGRKR